MDDDDDDSRGGVGDDSNDAFAFAQWNLYAQFLFGKISNKKPNILHWITAIDWNLKRALRRSSFFSIYRLMSSQEVRYELKWFEGEKFDQKYSLNVLFEV